MFTAASLTWWGKLLILLFCFSWQSCAADTDPAQLLEMLNEIDERITNMEPMMTRIYNESIEKFERILAERKQNLGDKLNEFKHEFGTKMEQLDESVANKLLSIEASLNVTKQEIEGYRKQKEKPKCMSGWIYYKDSCYYFSTFSTTWVSGRKECQRMGADYITISTDDELAFFRKQIKGTHWVGLNDLDDEDTFKWIADGSLHDASQHRSWWINYSPKPGVDDNDCVNFWVKWDEGTKMNDDGCTKEYSFVCETQPDKVYV